MIAVAIWKVVPLSLFLLSLDETRINSFNLKNKSIAFLLYYFSLKVEWGYLVYETEKICRQMIVKFDPSVENAYFCFPFQFVSIFRRGFFGVIICR